MAAKNCNFRGNLFCLDHLNEEVKFMCEDCKQKACDWCISTTHKGHNLIGMKLIVQDKYQRIQELSADIRESKIPRIKKSYQAAEESVKKISDEIHTCIKTAETHGNYLKELIDKYTVETVSGLKNIEVKITTQLDTFKSECDSLIKLLQDLMNESKEASNSNNDVLIVDIEEHMSTLTIEDPRFDCNIAHATFVKGSVVTKDSLGTIVYEQSPTILPKPTADILAEPIISKLLDIPDLPTSIQRTRQGTLWLVQSCSNEIMSLDVNASTKKLKLDVNVGSLCVGPVDDTLYCSTSRDIRILDTNKGKTVKLFDITSSPGYINITSDGSTFIVGILNKPEVNLYNRNGKLLQTMRTVGETFSIAVCTSTGKVAIACGKEGVMVVDNQKHNMHHMYNYSTKGGIVSAIDAAFNDKGLLFVPNIAHETIYVADAATGQTVKTINTDKPLLITVQLNGDLVFVGSTTEKKNIFGKNKIVCKLMTVKYLA